MLRERLQPCRNCHNSVRALAPEGRVAMGNAGSSLRSGYVVAALFSALILIGCNHRPENLWSTTATSPDGHYIAKGSSDVYGAGFGTDDAQTEVTLQIANGSQEPVMVFMIDDVSAPGDPALLKIQWLTSTHLAVTYESHQKPVFQAVRCYGLDVTFKQD